MSFSINWTIPKHESRLRTNQLNISIENKALISKHRLTLSVFSSFSSFTWYMHSLISKCLEGWSSTVASHFLDFLDFFCEDGSPGAAIYVLGSIFAEDFRLPSSLAFSCNAKKNNCRIMLESNQNPVSQVIFLRHEKELRTKNASRNSSSQ